MIFTLTALVLFAFATGIFAVLSALEKPVYPLMWNHAAPLPQDDIRQIHATLKRFIYILPPTMMTTMTVAFLALVAQAVMRGFDAWSLVALGVFVLLQGGISSILLGRIAAVKGQSSDDPIAAVRASTGKLAAVHHMGMALTALMVVLQSLVALD